MVSAGDHWSLRMSRQIDPFWLMLGWYTRVTKLTCGRGHADVRGAPAPCVPLSRGPRPRRPRRDRQLARLGGLERVVGREVDLHHKDPARVGRVGGPHDGGLPVEQVIGGNGPCERTRNNVSEARGGRAGGSDRPLRDPGGTGPCASANAVGVPHAARPRQEHSRKPRAGPGSPPTPARLAFELDPSRHRQARPGGPPPSPDTERMEG